MGKHIGKQQTNKQTGEQTGEQQEKRWSTFHKVLCFREQFDFELSDVGAMLLHERLKCSAVSLLLLACEHSVLWREERVLSAKECSKGFRGTFRRVVVGVVMMFVGVFLTVVYSKPPKNLLQMLTPQTSPPP